ncbi:hypothetical protein [Streptomyces rugosispiralis]|uniref:Secreted protein n=1 Tax=Streptomyces rugosispiralis TaxID=2967341 RepID=A0ABT1USJ9_9ACTN|nr:hypothetical protein [Streptomyces rugosispiralis]MCQ8188090.1 hypothetical protein [Streptomyces rugosispiralis]
MKQTKEPGSLRRIWRIRPLRFALIGLVCLVLLPVGCVGVLNAVSGECARPNAKVSESDLPGTYRGPHGMRITLDTDGSLEVRKWPYDPFLDDERRFEGRGVWSYDATEATDGDVIPGVRLGFQEGTPESDVPTEDQKLTVGGSPDDPVLLAQDDPDKCPDAEFRR